MLYFKAMRQVNSEVLYVAWVAVCDYLRKPATWHELSMGLKRFQEVKFGIP